MFTEAWKFYFQNRLKKKWRKWKFTSIKRLNYIFFFFLFLFLFNISIIMMIFTTFFYFRNGNRVNKIVVAYAAQWVVAASKLLIHLIKAWLKHDFTWINVHFTTTSVHGSMDSLKHSGNVSYLSLNYCHDNRIYFARGKLQITIRLIGVLIR